VPRRRANPIGWLGIALVVLLLALTVRAIGGRNRWQPAALQLAQGTSKTGREVTGLRTGLRSLDRLELFRRLYSWEREAREQDARVRDLSPPRESRKVNGLLVTALGLRADALHRFTPAVQNALSDRDLQVAVSQLVNVMRDLLLADRSYALFRDAWPKGQARPPPSQWIADPEDATIDGVTGFVRELRKQQSLASVYNLTLTGVAVDPKPTGSERGVDLIPFAKTIDVSVVVENTGNQVVPTTSVAAILTSEIDPVPRTVAGEIGLLRPKDRKSVTLRGLAPAAGGAINLLRVTVGPVAEERNTLDNTVEYKFVMRRP